MNIREAKEEIKHTLLAYTARNARGGYAIPPRHQRPVLLIGPPGIGKTAVMQQAAQECGVGFVSYTMTHHTRQSAVGLPFIKSRTFDGQEYSITEYTMSEIIASVYRCMEESGKKEGLLFLDEINCVSETLAPTMLQFLQNKTFGSHRLPDGWVLAAAGNPQEYNKSVREFDIATLDRLKYITVEADYDAWRAYALEAGIHGSILAYLDTHRNRFYMLEQTYASKTFATARGWEDLSYLLLQYEALHLPVTPALIGQYLHMEELARDFTGYYQFFISRKENLPVTAMLSGDEEAAAACLRLLQKAPFDEKLLFVHLSLSFLGEKLQSWEHKQKQLQLFGNVLERLDRFQKQQKLSSLAAAVRPFLEKEEEILSIRHQHGLSSDEEIQNTRQILYELRDLAYRCRSAVPVFRSDSSGVLPPCGRASSNPKSSDDQTQMPAPAPLCRNIPLTDEPESWLPSGSADNNGQLVASAPLCPNIPLADGSENHLTSDLVRLTSDGSEDRIFFEREKTARQDSLRATANELLRMLERCAFLLEKADGPELTLFVSSIYQNKLAVSFLKQHPSPLFDRLKERLQFASREEQLRQALENTLL